MITAMIVLTIVMVLFNLYMWLTMTDKNALPRGVLMFGSIWIYLSLMLVFSTIAGI